MTVGLLQCDPITLLKSLSWKSRLNVCSSSSGEGSERNVEPWPPCCWLSPVEPKWPLTQSPLLESTATLDLQEKFSFEDLSSWLPSSPARSPSPAVPLRVVPTLSTTDMKTADKIELGDSDLKLMLKKHHEKRKHQPVRLRWEWPFVIFSVMPLICPETVLVLSGLCFFVIYHCQRQEQQERLLGIRGMRSQSSALALQGTVDSVRVIQSLRLHWYVRVMISPSSPRG